MSKPYRPIDIDVSKTDPKEVTEDAYLPYEDETAPTDALTATSASLVSAFSSPADVNTYVLHEMVPQALSTYSRLMVHEDGKIAKAAADKVMELANVLADNGKTASSGPSFTLQLDSGFINAANKGMEKLIDGKRQEQENTITA
jgi:hypothetical protein